MWTLTKGVLILVVIYKLLPYVIAGIAYLLLINIKAGV